MTDELGGDETIEPLKQQLFQVLDNYDADNVDKLYALIECAMIVCIAGEGNKDFDNSFVDEVFSECLLWKDGFINKKSATYN
jgi:hypothetical protein